MTETMVERVAKAIYDKATSFDGDTIATHLSLSQIIDASTVGVDDTRETVMSVCRDAARAAIEAMRDPTEAVWSNAIGDGGWGDCEASEFVWRWQQAIDAALQEKTDA